MKKYLFLALMISAQAFGIGSSRVGVYPSDPPFEVTLKDGETVGVIQGTTPWIDNITQFGGSNVSTGIGLSGLGIPRVTVSDDSSLTNISGIISLPTNACQETGGNLDAILAETILGFATNHDDLNFGFDRNHSDLSILGSSIGSTSETAPGTDTATSGLNGRLQRIAQRLTTIDTDLNSGFSTNHSDLVTVNSSVTTFNSDSNTRLGATNETAPTNDTATSGLNGRAQRTAQNITTLNSDTNSGFSRNHNDLSIVGSSIATLDFNNNFGFSRNHLDLSILGSSIGSISELAPSTDTGTSGLNGRLQRVAQRLTTLDTDLNLSSSLNHSDLSILGSSVGATNETAPVTDIATSGLNGRLQRIAQNLTTANSNLVTIQGKQDTGNASLTSIDTKASTLITQTDGIETSLASIDGKLNSLGQKTMANSVPVVISSDQSSLNINNISGTVSLPTGAATSANQTSTNTKLDTLISQTDTVETSLSSIDGKTPTLGQKTMAGSSPVVLASDQSLISVALLDVAPATQNITALDVVTSSLAGANGQLFYFGTPTVNSAAVFTVSSISTVTVQMTLIGAGGTAVVETSADGGTFWLRPTVFQPSTTSYGNGFTAPFIATVSTAGMTHLRVRATVSWTGTGTIKVIETQNNRVVTVNESNLPTGASTSALQTSMNTKLDTLITQTDGIETTLTSVETRTGSLTETAPATDTASSGLNGRLQRVAQNLTTLDTDFNTKTGALTETAPASDTASSGLNGRLQRIAQRLTSILTTLTDGTQKTSLAGVSLTANSPTAATVGTSSAQAVAANAGRDGLILMNTSVNRISCALGVAAVLNSGITLFPGGTYNMKPLDANTGAVNCIASAASSNLAIQEYQ